MNFYTCHCHNVARCSSTIAARKDSATDTIYMMMIPSLWYHQLRNEELGQRILIYSIDCLIELPGIVESLKTRVCEGANSQSEEYVISITPLINSPASATGTQFNCCAKSVSGSQTQATTRHMEMKCEWNTLNPESVIKSGPEGFPSISRWNETHSQSVFEISSGTKKVSEFNVATRVSKARG